jgi:acyl-CoA synthetase (AMP-forming)/AMP-acid ligase II
MATEHPEASTTQTGSKADLIEHTPSAYGYPLLIKHLLHTPLAHAPDQEIVYRDLHRYDYRTLRRRIGQLASGLESLGVGPGDTVAVMDWDSHRYLECYFAVPMMGAVLQMVNVRLSPEQILYTINHVGSDVILIHTDFLSVLEEIQDRLETVKKIVLLDDGDERPEPRSRSRPSTKSWWSRAPTSTSSPTSTRTRELRPSILLARQETLRVCTSATGSWCCTRWRQWRLLERPRSRDVSTGRTCTCP